ncbi:MAG: carboxypeptidase-like regulatory domain-containing protein [Bacteroidota bacterium]
MKKYLPFVFCLFSFSSVFAQPAQTIRGKIIDKETHATLPGANVVLIDDTTKFIGASSDEDGNFRLENIVVGKHTLKISYIGYNDRIIDVTVTSAKEVILNIEIEESAIAMEEVVITATKRGEVNNEMALVSSRTFDVSETERYAGSRGDPARMASNFAGVQGADDSRNDIVVRGNSPLGVLYRVEGFDIPNPNHFSVAGSTGGPVSILNNKVLSNSDFFTSAFPSEYGNSTAAVFDLKFRNGNNEKHEFAGQLGFLGTELAAEGPLSKDHRASYLVAYRYSTLSIFQAIGLSIGTDAVPKYQDAAVKLNFPTKKNGNFAVFAMGGKSAIDIMISEQEKPATDFYGDDDRDQHFQTRMGIGGVTFTKTLKDNKTLMKTGLSATHERQTSQHDYILRHIDYSDTTWVLDSLYPLQRYRFQINKISYIINFNTKLNKNHVIKYGVNAHYMTFSFLDSALVYDHSKFRMRWDYNGTGILAQAYIQWKWKPSELLTVTSGLHNQYFSASNSLSVVEPRIGVKYQINEKQSINLGAGLHSQTQPYYTYYYQQYDSASSKYVVHNKNMDFTKSIHSVLGYDYAISATMRMKAEVYYQQLFNVPVEVKPSAFSLSNMGSGFARFFPDTLQNTGTGTNMGIELTVEKFFNKSFYFLFTASLFDAKYKGSDGIERNTDYNGQYATNLLIGKEFKTGDKSTLSLGTKITYAGGKWYGYVDTAASNYQNELVWLDSAYNTRQFRPYFRADFKINFKLNAKKVTHEFALDIVNAFGIKNILGLSYSPDPLNPTADPIRENYQLGFLPLFYYRIDF